jgi:hypothetical protein
MHRSGRLVARVCNVTRDPRCSIAVSIRDAYIEPRSAIVTLAAEPGGLTRFRF